MNWFQWLLQLYMIFIISVIYYNNYYNVLFFLGEESDYETWIPHGEGKNEGCLLGKKVFLRRPKKEILYVTKLEPFSLKSNEW